MAEGPIVLFMFDFACTGVVTNAVRLANALAARGRQVCLLVCCEAGREGFRIDPRVRVEVARGLLVDGRPARAWRLALSVPAMRRTLQRLAPSTLVSAGNHGHFWALVAALGMPDLRRVFRISNELDHPGRSWPVRTWRRFLHWMLIRHADRMLLVSAHLARHPLLARAIADGKAVITPNGVDVREVERLAAEPCAHAWMAGSEPVVVTVGRIVNHKNLDTLIRALARARQVRPMRLIVVGGGPAKVKRRLQRLAEQLGVAGCVHFTGQLANPFPFVARASVFVLPSLWEGASNALLEALACRVPVIAATSAGNAQEVLGYGRYGLLVDPLDVEGMAQAMLYQTVADACRPGNRAADFTASGMLSRACMAVTGDGSTAVAPVHLPAARGA